MYAIVSTGGKQYKVAKGDVIDVEKLNAQPGDKVTLDVLMLSHAGEVTVDASTLEGAKVEAEVVDQHKGEKVLVFKLKKRKRYHRTKGHRQNLTKLRIVGLPGEDVEETPADVDAVMPEEAIEVEEDAATVSEDVIEQEVTSDGPQTASESDEFSDVDEASSEDDAE